MPAAATGNMMPWATVLLSELLSSHFLEASDCLRRKPLLRLPAFSCNCVWLGMPILLSALFEILLEPQFTLSDSFKRLPCSSGPSSRQAPQGLIFLRSQNSQIKPTELTGGRKLRRAPRRATQLRHATPKAAPGTQKVDASMFGE